MRIYHSIHALMSMKALESGVLQQEDLTPHCTITGHRQGSHFVKSVRFLAVAG